MELTYHWKPDYTFWSTEIHKNHANEEISQQQKSFGQLFNFILKSFRSTIAKRVVSTCKAGKVMDAV